MKVTQLKNAIFKLSLCEDNQSINYENLICYLRNLAEKLQKEIKECL